MSDFQIDFQFADGTGARGPELAATWADVRILLAGRMLTEREDQRIRKIRDSLSIPLYPIAEWVAVNWWSLCFEDRARPGAGLHSLLEAREGFPLPNLSFRPQGEQMIVVCEPIVHEPSKSRFLCGAQQYLRKVAVVEELERLIEAVIQNLQENAITSTFLQREWARILASESDPRERAFCEHAARLGLDPYDMDATVGSRIDALLDRMPPTLTQDFFDSADVERLDEDAEPIFSFLDLASKSQHGGSGWRELRETVRIDTASPVPWQQGYGLAIQLRNHLGLQDHRFTGSDSDLMRAFGLDAPVYPWSSSRLDAITAFSTRGFPVFGVRGNLRESRKFGLCRAIGEALLQPGDPLPLIFTRTDYSERQKRSRAFAAEFLAPHSLIREELGSDHGTVTDEDLDELAAVFGVSSWVIRHQVKNHRLSEYIGPTTEP
jgi:hypothetical protein